MNKEKWVAGIWAMIEQYEGNLKDKDTAYMEVSKTIVNKIDAEVRKPLEEKIERLKKQLADLEEEYELTVEGFDREYAKQNVQLRKAFNERNNERQKVIAELEEWIKENHKDYICRTQTSHLQGKSFSPHMVGASISVYLDTFKSDLKQKLNEMKDR